MKRQKEEFAKKQEADRRQFEEKAQADRFNDIQNRFADKDDKTRANAALRLAEMGRDTIPGLEPTSLESLPSFTVVNFPYFLRAVSPLALALYMEDSAAVRDAVQEALETLANFAKGKDPDDILLHAMIVKLYNANIAAKREFITALAEYCNVQGDENLDMDILVEVANFADEPAITKLTLDSLMDTDVFRADRAIHQKTHGLSADELVKISGSLLAKVKLNAARLVNNRNVLTSALRNLSRAKDAPPNDADYEVWASYEPANKVNLKDAFLVASNLKEVFLPKANFSGCDLQGAMAMKACLQGAWFNSVKAQRAWFNFSSLQETVFPAAQLQNTHFINTRLHGAFLEGANLQNADLHGAKVAQSNLDWAIDVPSTIVGSDFFYYQNGIKQKQRDEGLITRLREKHRFEAMLIPSLSQEKNDHEE